MADTFQRKRTFFTFSHIARNSPLSIALSISIILLGLTKLTVAQNGSRDSLPSLASQQPSNNQPDRNYFVNRILEQYGDGISITVNQLQKMLDSTHTYQEADIEHGMDEKEMDENDAVVLSASVEDKGYQQNGNKSCDSDWVTDQECLNSKCLTAAEIFTFHGIKDPSVNASGLQAISTTLLYTVQNKACATQTDNTTEIHHVPNPAEVWGYSFLCVTVINLCSLMGMVFMPLMQKSFYKRLLMFMVALAVGTLSGSSLLFLLPECFDMGSEHSPVFHDYVWKCTTVLGGIYMFFLLERVMKNIMDWRKKVRKFDSDDSTVNRVTTDYYSPLKRTEASDAPDNTPIGSLKTRDVHLHDSMNMSFSVPNSPKDRSNAHVIKSVNKQLENSVQKNKRDNHLFNNDHTLEIDSSNSVFDTSARMPSTSSHASACPEPAAEPRETNPKAYSNQLVSKDSTPSFADFLRPNMSSAQLLNKSTAYSSESSPSTPSTPSDTDAEIKSVAWMVIFGDGLHNFIDGLSIGAAFSKNILAGVSVSLAVVCEELPHELGDFAILLNSGMSMKQALSYNFLSACMCYLGLAIGIIVGEMTSGSTWIFALAAGMFLYISLVDMLPEVNHAAEEEGKASGQTWRIFFLQNTGLLTGYAIMLVLAVYSDEINFDS